MGWYSSTYNPLHGTGWLSDPDDISLTAKTIRRTKEAPLHYIHSFEVPGPFHIPSTSRLFPSTSLSLHCTWDRLFPLFFFLASSKVVNDTYLSTGSIYGTTATFLQPLGRPEASKRLHPTRTAALEMGLYWLLKIKKCFGPATLHWKAQCPHLHTQQLPYRRRAIQNWFNMQERSKVKKQERSNNQTKYRKRQHDWCILKNNQQSKVPLQLDKHCSAFIDAMWQMRMVQCVRQCTHDLVVWKNTLPKIPTRSLLLSM